MYGLESISSLLSQGQKLLVVIRQSVGVAPWQQDKLAVAVDAVVEDPVPLSLHDVVAHMNSLNLRPGLRSMVSVTASIIGGTSFIPVESIVSIGISTLRQFLKCSSQEKKGSIILSF